VGGNSDAVALAAAALRKATMCGGSRISLKEGATVDTELGAYEPADDGARAGKMLGG